MQTEPGGISGKPRKRKDLTGVVRNSFTVLRPIERQIDGSYVWLCRCICGKELELSVLEISNHKSCGCVKADRTGPRGHYLSDVEYVLRQRPEYSVWRGILKRCNPRNKNKVAEIYRNKGITVCARWRKSFKAFLTDMGPRPSMRHTVDRIDNSGDYEPGNCRWATMRQQAHNRSNNTNVTHEGRTQCLSAWADELGIDRRTMASRHNKGDKGDFLMRPVVKRNGIERFS